MAHHFLFGTGNLFVVPATGGALATLVNVAAIQNVSVDIDGDAKMLYGQNAFPLDTARGKQKITGKFEVGQVNLDLWNAVFFGLSTTVGQTLYAFNEAGTIPAPSGPYTVTVANSAHFTQDLGVYYAATGVFLEEVASGPVTGEYSVNAATGVYTFAAADASLGVIINYEYSSSTLGHTLAVTNTQMGSIPTFGLHLNNITKGKTSVLKILCCTSSKLSFPFKQDDYGLQTFDFSAQDDGTGNVINWSVTGTGGLTAG